MIYFTSSFADSPANIRIFFIDIDSNLTILRDKHLESSTGQQSGKTEAHTRFVINDQYSFFGRGTYIFDKIAPFKLPGYSSTRNLLIGTLPLN